MKHLALLSLFGLGLISVLPQAMADPSADLRVIVADPEAGDFNTLTFATSPFDGDVFSINAVGDLDTAENIVAFDGDVYVADSSSFDDVSRIVRINLDASGLPEGGIGNNVDAITDDIFSVIRGMTVDSNGILYVADSDNKIYTVNPSGAPSASRTLVNITPTFVDIRDITIDGNFLYILDAGSDAIYKVDLSNLTVTTAYSGSTGAESLTNTFSIAVSGNDIFVSGSSFTTFGAGILKITPTTTVEFSDNTGGELFFPLDMVIDEAGNDLYVIDGVFLYRFSLANTPSQPILEIQSDSFAAPGGLAKLTITGQVADLELSITKTVNATQAAIGDGLLYTITATNEGPDPATTLLIHDFFPDPGVESVETSPGQLSFTSEVHDVSEGTVTEAGHCERRGTNAFIVDCDDFGTLDAGDFVVVKLEGIIKPGGGTTLINQAVVENFGENAVANATTTVASQLSLVKTASPTSVIAGGDGFIDYVIRVENQNPADAEDVIITDILPDGVSDLNIISQPSPASCQVTPIVDGTTILECGPYDVENTNGVVEIKYNVKADVDAIGPIENSAELKCTNCESIQTTTSTDIIRQSDLFIDKTSNANSVVPGQDSILYTLTIVNNGPSDAADVVVTDNLPTGVTFEESNSTECLYDSDNHSVICTLTSPLVVGEERTLTITVSVNPDASGDLINTANITSSSLDDNEEDNQAESEPIQVEPETDVSLIKTGPENAVVGGKIIYNLSVTNSGPSAALDVTVEDVLPPELIFIDHTQPESLTDPDCFDDIGTIICEFGDIGAGVTQTKSIQAQIPIDFTGTITNEAEVFSESDSDPDNNVSTLVTTIKPPFCGRAEDDYDSIIFGTEGNDNIKGTNGDDLIFGLGGNDKIQGRDGDDCIFGGDGNDKIHGGKGNDTIEGNNGNDKIHGQQGDDVIIGGEGNDKIHGGKGNDVIDGGEGNNQIHGNQGNDIITSGNGNDKIWGGQGDDNIDAGSGKNKIHGNQGNDTITSGDGNDIIHGGQGNDIIHAGSGNDKINGAQGDDDLLGEDGDDIIHGGQGDDFLDGGEGYDKCHGAQGNNTVINCEVEDKKIKEDKEDAKEDDEDDEDDDEDDE